MAAAQPEILLEGIEKLTFSYFGKTEDVADSRWREEWTIADRLPSLIKVSIQLIDGSYWPDMVLAPKINQAPSIDRIGETDFNSSITDNDAR